MPKDYYRSRSRKWRSILLVATILAAFSAAWNPAWAAPRQHSALSALHSPQSSPADEPIPAPYEVSAGRFRYFSQTAHFLRGAFLGYWEVHGGTPVLGLPITEALDEDGLAVQYLERARLEWHPEIQSPDPRNRVLLTRLGAILTEEEGLMFPRLPAGDTTSASVFFKQTGHTLSHGFLTYWRSRGGLAVFGYPISEEVAEVSRADGKQYTVQYFERNRFEWHPENPPALSVQLGLLGVEYARSESLNPLARILLPAAIKGVEEDLSDSPELAQLVDGDLLLAVQALGHTEQFRWVPAIIVQNNIPVEFADIGEEGVAGAFISTRSRTRPYVIVVAESERGQSVVSIASVLAHEATHAFDVTSGVTPSRLRCSIEEELRAYMNGLAAWVILQGEGALAQTYEPGSLNDAVNRSVRGFNSRKDELDFDFSPQKGREFLRGLYGSDCGS